MKSLHFAIAGRAESKSFVGIDREHYNGSFPRSNHGVFHWANQPPLISVV